MAEGGLRAQRMSQSLIGDNLQERIVAQAAGVAGVFVSGDDLVEALPQQRQRIMTQAVLLPRIADSIA